jgi:hypothetical protein
MSLKEILGIGDGGIGDIDGVPFVDPVDLEKQQLRRDHQRQLLRQHFIEFPAHELEHHNGRIIHAGQVFARHHAVVLDKGSIVNNDPTAFYVDTDGDFHFLVRTGSVAQAEREAQAREQRRAEARESQRQAFAALPRTPVTAAEIAGKNLPTLAEAVRRIEQHGGAISARDGELIVELAPTGIPDRERILNACRAVFAAQTLVLDALAKNADELADVLPDQHVRAGGGIE